MLTDPTSPPASPPASPASSSSQHWVSPPSSSAVLSPEIAQPLRDRIAPILRFLYPEADLDALLQRLESVVAGHISSRSQVPRPLRNGLRDELRDQLRDQLWDEQSVVLITYGDSLVKAGEVPLQILAEFLQRYCRGMVSAVHILPFCPYSSDDGFAVIDYRQINPVLGDWTDIEAIAQTFDLMADLVINHVSSQSEWFQQYLAQQPPGRDYFIEADPSLDWSAVVRPRSSPLLTPVETAAGVRHVWTTFSADQVDLEFHNPAVLLEFVDILLTYCWHGARLVRLDAVGFLWKKAGTPSIHLPETHGVIRLLRAILGFTYPNTILITETNVPNRENLSYFGNRNEAHAIYNFSLPPLLINALLRGESRHLKTWMMSMPPAPEGCTYLNFIASHDGIGLRPAEGLLDGQEYEDLLTTMQAFGGTISYRQQPDGSQSPYELNISLFDALQGTVASGGPDGWQRQRFLCAQTIMLALEGIPAFYIHSLLATPNDQERRAQTGHNRSINRHQWNYETLCDRLADPASDQSWVFHALHQRIAIRRQQPAFHPNATQYTLYLINPHVFGLWRQSRDRAQSIFCLHNLSDRPQNVSLSNLNLICTDEWWDLLSEYVIQEGMEALPLAPYQAVWLANSPRPQSL